MGSIAVKIQKEKRFQDIEEMNRRLGHRGELHNEILNHGILALGTNTNESQNLMKNNPSVEKQGLIIAIDGEIFDQEQLKKEFPKDKIDTTIELIAALYRRDFTKFLPRLNGDFVIFIYDKHRDIAIVARDAFGVKPFFYTNNTKDGSMMMASEIKAFIGSDSFKKELNNKALSSYLSFQYAPGPGTFFEEVYALAPGSYLLIDVGRNCSYSIEKYYEYEMHPIKGDQKELEEQLITVLKKAVERRRSPGMGSFLSGGIDSSLITTLLMPEKTFSIGFDEETGIFDESIHAKELADILGIENIKYELTGEEAFEKLGEIQYFADQPHGNLSTVPLYFLANMAKKHVDSVQSGEGADEFFGGYSSFIDGPQMRKYKKLPLWFRKGMKSIAKNQKGKKWQQLVEAGSDVEEYFIGEAKIFTEQESRSVLRPPYDGGHGTDYYTKPLYQAYRQYSDLQKKQMIDIELFMPWDILVKADRMTSSCSLGIRAPFMDREIIEISASLEDSMKSRDGISKYLIREMAKNQLPEEWVKRKKLGFPVPMKFWLLRTNIYEQVRSYFVSDMAKEFFETKKIIKLLNDHYEQKAMNQRYIYVIFAFLKWYEEYFIKR
ncbi:MAG: asparagine synthase (glutamine-hydrolyzing) [Tissierellia bacterium]|nr:asparagine synthase (glutamine-hydrolyzing) [Tissierellia bacterium]